MSVFWLWLVSFVWAAPPGWELVGNRDGIEVARKTMPGSPLFAFRGEANNRALALPTGLNVGLSKSS